MKVTGYDELLAAVRVLESAAAGEDLATVVLAEAAAIPTPGIPSEQVPAAQAFGLCLSFVYLARQLIEIIGDAAPGNPVELTVIRAVRRSLEDTATLIDLKTYLDAVDPSDAS